jgi:hypothetical protein
MTLLDYLNTIRCRVAMPPLAHLPTVDDNDFQARPTYMMNPVHVMIGLAFRSRVKDWALDCWDHNGQLVISSRMWDFKGGYVANERLPDSVWLEICAKWPYFATTLIFAKQDTSTATGLESMSAGAWPAERQRHSMPPSVLMA